MQIYLLDRNSELKIKKWKAKPWYNIRDSARVLKCRVNQGNGQASGTYSVVVDFTNWSGATCCAQECDRFVHIEFEVTYCVQWEVNSN